MKGGANRNPGLSDDRTYDEKDPVAQVKDCGPAGATIAYPAHRRSYVLLRTSEGGEYQVVAERNLLLEKGSSSRDLGGYLGADGGVEAYLATELDIGPDEIERLCELYLN